MYNNQLLFHQHNANKKFIKIILLGDISGKFVFNLAFCNKKT